MIVYTALAPETDIGAPFEAEGGRHAMGEALGQIERAILEEAGIGRGVIAGGDRLKINDLMVADAVHLTTQQRPT